MSARRFFVILATAVALLTLAMWLGGWRAQRPDAAGTLLLPNLDQKLDEIDSVTIRNGTAQSGVTLHKQGVRWVVVERSDYPANTPKLRELLLAIARARVIEEKSSDPATYGELGVDDPTRPGAAGTEIKITMTTTSGTQRLIVGKASMGGNFVRLGGTAPSLFVAPGIAADSQPRDWIEPHILAIKPADIREVHVKQASRAQVTLPSTSFAALAGLTALDVAPVGGIDFNSAAVATVTLTDGSVLTLRGTQAGDTRWVTNASNKDVAFQVASSSFAAIFAP